MKKLAFFILISSLLSCQNNKNFTINSNISGIKDGTIAVLYKLDTRNFETLAVDSTQVFKGQFKLSGPIPHHPAKYQLQISTDTLNHKQAYITVWVENNDITINGDIGDTQNLKITGSALNKIQHQFDNVIVEFGKKVKQKMDSEMKTASSKDEFNNIIKKYMLLIDKERLNFIYKNPNNMVSLSNIFIFTDKISKDSLKTFYDKLSPKLQNSESGIALKNIISIKKLKVGDAVANFKAFDLNGNSVQFSDFKGKVILLDFWANWCYWCHIQNREEFSQLYKKYGNEKFVIISYALDTKKSYWETSSKKDSIQWLNISNLKGMNDPIAIQFGVSSLPTSFLIGKNGIIQKSFNGYVKDSIERLENNIKFLLSK